MPARTKEQIKMMRQQMYHRIAYPFRFEFVANALRKGATMSRKDAQLVDEFLTALGAFK